MTRSFLVVMTVLFFGLLCMAAGTALGSWLANRAHERRAAVASAKRALWQTSKQKPEWIRSTQSQPGTAGFTIAAALNGVGCLGRSRSDEPVFVLCARDRAASMAVRDWAALASKLGANPAKVSEADAIADRMEAWRLKHGGGKIPD